MGEDFDFPSKKKSDGTSMYLQQDFSNQRLGFSVICQTMQSQAALHASL